MSCLWLSGLCEQEQLVHEEKELSRFVCVISFRLLKVKHIYIHRREEDEMSAGVI